MSLTPEEMAALPEETQAKIREMIAQSEQEKVKMERLQIEKEAAENLLSNVDLRRPGTSAIESSPRDSTGLTNFQAMVKDAGAVEVDDSELDKEIDEAAKSILSRFSDEQLQNDPNTIRAAIHMFGKTVGTMAFKRAFQHSVNVFQKAVQMKANIDSVITQWRIDNPDLANDKQSEDIVEFFLMKRVIVDPKNKAKQLPALLDLATDMARDYLKGVRQAGKEEERRNLEEKVTPLTLRPRGAGSGAGRTVTRTQKEDEPMTPEESAERYLAMRQKQSQKTAWTGRPI